MKKSLQNRVIGLFAVMMLVSGYSMGQAALSSAIYLDTDADGTVDRVDVTYDDDISTSSFENSDWTFPTNPHGLTVSSGAIAGSVVQITIGGAPAGNTGLDATTVQYTNQGTTGSITNGTTPSATSAETSISDGAGPVVTDLQIEDTDEDGLIDKVVVTFSENVDTDDGGSPIVADVGTITLPDGNVAGGFGNGDITDPGGSSATVTVDNITGQAAANTAVGSSDINGIDGLWVDGDSNPVLAAGDDSEGLTDAAAPIVSDLDIYDTDNDALIDRIDVTWSENIDTFDGDPPDDTDFGTIKLPDNENAELGSASFTDPGGSSAVISITGISGQLTANTGVGSTAINGITNEWTDGINQTSNPDENEGASDSAAPRILNATWSDENLDGSMDRVVLTFSEPMDIADGAAGDGFDGIIISDGGGHAIDDADYAATSQTSLTLDFTNDQVTGTDITGLSATYEDSGNDAITENGAPNTEIADGLAADANTDGAAPAIIDLDIYDDAGNDGLIDRIDITWSENVDTKDLDPPQSGDFGTIVLPDGENANLGSAAFTDPGGGTTIVSITGITGQVTPNTGVGATSIDGNTNKWWDGINTTSNPDDFEGVTDSAAPRILEASWEDGDTDGDIDQVTLTFSEAMAVTDAGAGFDAILVNDGSAVTLDNTDFSAPNTTTLTLTFTGDQITGTGITTFTGTVTYATAGASTITEFGPPNTEIADALTADSYTDGALPQIQTQSMDAENVYMDVTFTEGVYDNGGGALAPADFTFTFLDNNGNVTDLTLQSIKQNNTEIEATAGNLAGGESILRFFFNYTNNASGEETIEISPNDGASIYDVANNVMDAGQTTGAINMNDLLAPSIVSDEISFLSATTLQFTMSEELDISEGGTITGFSVAVAGSISPPVLYTGKGTTNLVTITGTGFTGATTVSYDQGTGNVVDFVPLELAAFAGQAVVEGAPITFQTGDIAFTEFRSDEPDHFIFVLLKDAPMGTKIKFTDYGWLNTDAFRIDSEGNVVTWEADDQFYFAGTEIKIWETDPETALSASSGKISGSDRLLFNDGSDQIIAFQGTTQNPQVLTAIQFAQGSWDADADNDGNSDIPYDFANAQDLVNGTNAIVVDKDNGSYLIGTQLVEGSTSVLSTSINTVAKWSKNDTPGSVTVHSAGNNFTLPPNISSNWTPTPANGGKINSGVSTLTFDFGQNISAGTTTGSGDIQIWNDAHDTQLGSGFDIGDTEVTISGTSVTIDVSSLTFVSGTIYEVDLAEKIITDDTDGNANKAITGDTYWKFTIDDDPPTILSGTVDLSNDFIDVVFNEPVFNTSGASGGLEVGDFTIDFQAGASTTLTNVTIFSAKQNDNASEGSASALVGGETTIRLFLTLTGTPDGQETIEINPVATSIYDEAGNSSLITQTTGAKPMNDKLPPFFVSADLAADITYIDLTFDEGVYDTGGGSGALEVGDFNFDFQQNTGTLVSMSVSSVKQNNNVVEGSASPLSGGETVVRMFLNNSGQTPNGDETIEIKPNNNTSIYDVEGNASPDTETTGLVPVEDNFPPTIQSATLASDNSYLEVTMSEPVYTNFTGTGTANGGLAPGDFIVNFLLNGGNVTAVSVSSVTQNDGTTPPAGGETVLRLFLNITGGTQPGLPKGVESIEIQPATASSIYDLPENAMLDTETTGVFVLNDQFLPSLTIRSIAAASAPTDKAIAGEEITLSITADETLKYSFLQSNVTFLCGGATINDGSLTFSPTSDAASYTIKYTTDANDTDGPVTFSIDYQDLVGNAGSTVTTVSDGSSVIFDDTKPLISDITFNTDPVYEGSLTQTVSVLFNEDMDVTLNPTINLTGSNWGAQTDIGWLGDNRTFQASFTHNGAEEEITITATVPSASGAKDFAGNVNDASTGTFTFEVDTDQPAATITYSDSDIYPDVVDGEYYFKDGQTIRITATFDEPMAGAPIVKIELTGTNTLTPTDMVFVSITEYYYDFIVGTGDGQVNVLLSTGTDVPGNLIKPTPTDNDFYVDNTPPLLVGSPYNPPSNIDPTSNNLPLNQLFTVTFQDKVYGAGAANVNVKISGGADNLLNGDDILNSYAFAASFTPTLELQKDYDIIIGPDAFVDRAGNPYAGNALADQWTGLSSFGDPIITDPITNAACIGDEITISGDFLTGVNEVVFGTTSPQTVTSFNIDNDGTIRVNVPNNALYGETITLNKLLTGGNYADAIGSSISTIKLGPTIADFILNGTQYVCDDPAGSLNQTDVQINVLGGSGTYDIVYNDSFEDKTLSGYVSGTQFQVNPPNVNDNSYTLVSVTDADPDVNSCTATNGAPITVTEFARSLVDGGGSAIDNSIEVCLATTSEIDFSNLTLMGTIPTIIGSVVSGEWEIIQGPAAGSGDFGAFGSGSDSPFTSTTTLATYYPSLADAAFEGGLVLKLTSDDPSTINVNNPCQPASDELFIKFVSTLTAFPGPDFTICEDEPITNISTTFGGGADGVTWSTTTAVEVFDNTWGFTNDDITYLETSTDVSTMYRFSPSEVANKFAILEVMPSTTGTPCGPAPDPTPIRIDLITNPITTVAIANTSVCVGQTNEIYSVNTGATQSSYVWTIDNEGFGPNDNVIVTGQGTNTILVNWGTDHAGINTITVQENRDSDGCPAVAETIDVTVNALPVVTFVQPLPGVRAFSKDGFNQPLIGAPAPDPLEIDDARFEGPGVIKDENNDFFFDPDIAGSGSTHDITYYYTDILGCTGTLTEQFAVFDASASIVLVDEDTDPNNDIVLADEYCEDYGILDIRVSPAFPNAVGYEFHAFSGPGIIDNGDGTWSYDPGFAADPAGTGANREGGVKVIEYTQHLITDPIQVIEWGSQITDVNLIPPLANDPLPQSQVNLLPASGVYCSHDDAFILTRDQALNPLASFSFSVVGGDPHGLIIEGAGPTFTFNPLNEFHPDSSYYDTDDFTAHVVTVEYAYEYFYAPDDDFPNDLLSCNDVTQFDLTVYQRPLAPISDPVFGCEEGKTVEALTVNDPVPGATIRWYDNPNLSGVPVQGASFDSGVTTLGTTSFYVTQEINGCESLPTEVTVTITTVLEEDVSFTIGAACQNEDTQFTSDYAADPAVGGTIEAWAWNFGDDNAIGGTNTSDLENPTHAYSVAGTYNVTLTVTNNGGCAATVSKFIDIGEIPVPDFVFEAIATQKTSIFTSTTPLLASSEFVQVMWRFEEADGTLIEEEIITDKTEIDANNTKTITFTTIGNKKAIYEVRTDKGCVRREEKVFFIVPFVEVTSTSSYSVDFNDSDDGWVSWGFDTPTNEWSFGAATGTFEDASKGNSWFTVPDTNPADISFVYSPCFDISGLVRPVVTLNTFTDTDNGALLQYSTDGRFGEWETLGSLNSGIEWYNVEQDPNLNDIPGNAIGYSWQNSNEFGGEWLESRNSLTDIDEGRDNVVFRVVFRGTNSNATEGFAFDDFRIDDRDRIVLLEHFENITDSDTDNLNEIQKFREDAGVLDIQELVKIQYRTGFEDEDDPLYKENQSDVNARALFYDITDANRAVMDGDNRQADPFSVWGESEFGTKSLTDPKLEFIDISVSQNPQNGEMDFSVKLKSREDLPEFITHIAIVENPVGAAEYVMRKMVPDASGTTVPSLSMADGEITLPVITWEKPIQSDKLSAIVFAQLTGKDGSSTEVLQAAIVEIDFSILTALNEEITSALLLYPNPASEMLNVVFKSKEQKTVRVFDQFGKMVFDQDLAQGVSSLQIETGKLASGVYFIQVESADNELIREKFILSH